jgi:exodeoxyribonuclease-1
MKNWYDFETSDAHSSTQVLQFASVSTDDDLNVIPGSENNLIVKPRTDMLISPYAAMVHMLDPDYLKENGMTERAVVKKIIDLFLYQPNSQQCGFNNLKFDDIVLRHSAFRNMHNPYLHEWRDGNSRYDVFKLVQFVYALRPELLEFPKKEDGSDSLKLEALSKANGIIHERAHDALSDVYATIGLAKIIRDGNRKLYEYSQGLMDQKENERLILKDEPILHVGFKFGQANRLTSLIYPLIKDESNKKKYLYADLREDPYNMINMNPEELKHHLFTKRELLPENAPKVPVGGLQINDMPLIIGTKGLLNDQMAQRINLDPDACNRHLEMIRASRDLRSRIQRIFRYPNDTPKHVFSSLYSGGFISNADQGHRNTIVEMSDEEVNALDAVEMAAKREDKLRMLELIVGMKENPTDLVEKALKYRQLKTVLIDDDSRLNFSKFDAAILDIRISRELTDDQELLLEKITNQRNEIEQVFQSLENEVLNNSVAIDAQLEKRGLKWLTVYMRNEFPSGVLETKREEPDQGLSQSPSP